MKYTQIFEAHLGEFDLSRYEKHKKVTYTFDNEKIVGRCIFMDTNFVDIEFIDDDLIQLLKCGIQFHLLPSWIEENGKKILYELSMSPKGKFNDTTEITLQLLSTIADKCDENGDIWTASLISATILFIHQDVQQLACEALLPLVEFTLTKVKDDNRSNMASPHSNRRKSKGNSKRGTKGTKI